MHYWRCLVRRKFDGDDEKVFQKGDEFTITEEDLKAKKKLNFRQMIATGFLILLEESDDNVKASVENSHTKQRRGPKPDDESERIIELLKADLQMKAPQITAILYPKLAGDNRDSETNRISRRLTYLKKHPSLKKPA
jgi:hypothetical protein